MSPSRQEICSLALSGPVSLSVSSLSEHQVPISSELLVPNINMALCQGEETVLTGNQKVDRNSGLYCHLVVRFISCTFKSLHTGSPPLLSAGRWSTLKLTVASGDVVADRVSHPDDETLLPGQSWGGEREFRGDSRRSRISFLLVSVNILAERCRHKGGRDRLQM